MSSRASAVPTPPSSNAGEFQDGFQQLIQHNSSYSHHSLPYDDRSNQAITDGLGLGVPIYGDDGLPYDAGESPFAFGQPQGIENGLGYETSPYDVKRESRYGPVPDDPQLYGYGSHAGSPAPSAMSPPLTEVRRTRSGHAINRPLEQLKSSPKQTYRSVKPPKTKRVKKEKVKVKAEKKAPRLEQPLSEMTKTWVHVPVVDIEAYVNRPVEQRRKEVEEGKNPGKVKRPMNSFMLYRKAYQNRIKNWCLQNNHQVVSQVCGDSWPLEPDSVREQFNDWAKTERQNHQNAHPGYKFSPSKAGTTKAVKRKATVSEEPDLEDFDWEGAPSRPLKQQKLTPKPSPSPPAKFESTPYYGYNLDSRGSSLEPVINGVYAASTYHTSNPRRNPPDPYGQRYTPNGQYWPQQVVSNEQNPNVQDLKMTKVITPVMNTIPHLGYQHIYYQHENGMGGGMGEYPYSGHYDEPDIKIDPSLDPSLMAHASPYVNLYGISNSDGYVDDGGHVFNQPQLLQPPSSVGNDLQEEYPEYLDSQIPLADTHTSHNQIDDPDTQHSWQVVDSLDAGDEFNNKWMDGEAGQEV